MLHSFERVQGSNPYGALISDAAGNLFGTTYFGGAANYGTVFELDASTGYTLTTLHSFGLDDGAYPMSGLIADAAGNLFGTTSYGGMANYGTVFKLDPVNGYAMTVLHAFVGSDGGYPEARLLSDAAGNLYGTTENGGAFGGGTVFKLDASNGYALTTLHDFAGPDGWSPQAELIFDLAGNLYGTTSGGGSGHGTVFKLAASSNYALTTLHAFANAPDGANPEAGLMMDSAGNLYGTTFVGGSGGSCPYGCGTVFRLDASNNFALTTLHPFVGSAEGTLPRGVLIADLAGNLYGTTYFGGASNSGTVFKLDSSAGYALTTLHHFTGSCDFDGVCDGGNPEAGLIADAAGNLYGTTYENTVFTLDASNNYALTALESFGFQDGAAPVGALIADSVGNLYGTTEVGGGSNNGTVFKLDASRGYALTRLHTFTNADGRDPFAGLLADSAGNLYGTTTGGTVFKLDAGNGYALTTLHQFAGTDGAYPESTLIADADGNLYGTTYEGGTFGYGTAFRLDASNGYAVTTLHFFAGPDGALPGAGMIAVAAGDLYGTTSQGGTFDDGTVFKLDASNGYELTTLHSFSGPDGKIPTAELVADSNGNLYGTTSDGGVSGVGTVFKLDASSGYALSTLHDFAGADGARPRGRLLFDSAGNIYGTTSYGGALDNGSVFRLDASNNYALTTIHSFTDADGAVPLAGLIMDSAGYLYGTTYLGGAAAAGTVFTITSCHFNDVHPPNPFYTYICTISRDGITAGCGGGDYCPTNPVRRDQMAVFLLKGEHGSAYTPPPCAGVFPDTLCPGPFTDWVEQLAAEQITGGCGGGNYCPISPVTRAQMAVFLLKAEHGTGYTPPNCAGIFGDVPCPSQFANWVEQLAVENITAGCGGDNYCPDNPNTRGQMAVFLVKTFGLPFD